MHLRNWFTRPKSSPTSPAPPEAASEELWLTEVATGRPTLVYKAGVSHSDNILVLGPAGSGRSLLMGRLACRAHHDGKTAGTTVKRCGTISMLRPITGTTPYARPTQRPRRDNQHLMLPQRQCPPHHFLADLYFFREIQQLMAISIISDESGQGRYVVLHGNVERQNPLEYLRERYLSKHLTVGCESLREAGMLTPDNQHIVQEMFRQNALAYWPETLAYQTAEPVPQYLLDVLNATDKKAQIRLLRGATITTRQLLAFICKAWEQGYTFSRYAAHHNPRGTDATKLPRLFGKRDDGSIETIGQTSLSEAQLKTFLDHRKVIVATILDKGDDWHCFFNTYRALEGRETYKEGQPHMHYISSKWGNVTRQQVVDEINAGEYVSTNVHIDLLDLSLEATDSPDELGLTDASEGNAPQSTEPDGNALG